MLEGIALYWEFDVLPGASRLRSRPLLFMALLCLDNALREPGDHDLDQLLAETLSNSRFTRGSTERRLRVLSTSLEDPSGYLLGYLFVKTWRRWASAKASLFCDRDFAMFFLSEYVFNDYDLVELLLKPEGCNPADVIVHCMRRISSLFDGRDWVVETERFERATLDFKPDLLSLDRIEVNPIVFDTPSAGPGRSRLQAFVSDLPFEDQVAMVRRTSLHLASLPVDVVMFETPERGLMARFRGRPALVARVDEAYHGQGGSGTLDVFFETAAAAKCVAVSVGDEVAHLSVQGPERAYIDRWARQFPLARTPDSSTSFEAIAAKRGLEFTERYHAVIDLTINQRTSTYLAAALGWVPATVRANLRAEPAGFASLMSRQSLKALAVLSAASASGAYLEEVEITDEPVDLGVEVDRINATFENLGLPAIALAAVEDESGRTRTRFASWL